MFRNTQQSNNVANPPASPQPGSGTKPRAYTTNTAIRFIVSFILLFVKIC